MKLNDSLNSNIDSVCRILIVDDEEGMCLGGKRTLDGYKSELETFGTEVSFSVHYVTSCKDYREVIEKESFDIFFVDYKLEDGTGFEILSDIKQHSPDAPVVMITAYANLETAIQATKLGAFDFLAKPFSPQELRRVAEKAANHYFLKRKARAFEDEKKKIRFQFISVLSHELKAPINAIDGYLNILNSNIDTISKEDMTKMLGRCSHRIDGMRKLIFDILDLTRIESGEKKRTVSTEEVTKIFLDSIENYEISAQDRSIEIEHNIKDPIEMECDPTEIQIIANNLISNAIKYNVDEGKVLIRLTNLEDSLEISVRDTGIGISKEDQERLFNEFVRIRNAKTIKIEGSGLGLSTVKKICNFYGGSVTVKSEENQGTEFIITLKKTSKE